MQAGLSQAGDGLRREWAFHQWGTHANVSGIYAGLYQRLVIDQSGRIG